MHTKSRVVVADVSNDRSLNTVEEGCTRTTLPGDGPAEAKMGGADTIYLGEFLPQLDCE